MGQIFRKRFTSLSAPSPWYTRHGWLGVKKSTIYLICLLPPPPPLSISLPSSMTKTKIHQAYTRALKKSNFILAEQDELEMKTDHKGTYVSSEATSQFFLVSHPARTTCCYYYAIVMRPLMT